MIDELRELYQEVILDHAKNPRNMRTVNNATHSAWGNNPVCGDKLAVYLKLDDNKITDIGFQGEGCAISLASASLMTEIVKGKTLEAAKQLYEAFHDLTTGVTETASVPEHLNDDFERLVVLSGVRSFPMRVKCATLAWHTHDAAVHGQDSVTTE